MQPQRPLTIRGRTFGFAILITLQLIIGTIHVIFGIWFLSYPRIAPFLGSGFSTSELIYGGYTLVFGLLTLFFAAALWTRKSVGWIGTLGVSVFVIVADSLTLLNLPSVPGIPRLAAGPEIIYSLFVLIYLFQPKARIRKEETQKNCPKSEVRSATSP